MRILLRLDDQLQNIISNYAHSWWLVILIVNLFALHCSHANVGHLACYFRNTSIKDFSLIIFDEVHHSNGKGAPYDLLMKSYVTEKVSNPESAHLLPQVLF